MRKKCIHATMRKRGPYPSYTPYILVDYKFKDDAAREKALMRHPWYQKQKAWEFFRATLPAANVHPDFHTTEQRVVAAAAR